eukprot:TRINITY_DN62979_c0_g1_i1.p1 TRINITY_DN62979_c0_g1~~TRINITY_DN62979_c0_g1_i1.p1  ORF type:complete len:430 (+),score=33.25 TRINITY_DN62979_c0_g1_i1:175-1290(+)
MTPAPHRSCGTRGPRGIGACGLAHEDPAKVLLEKSGDLMRRTSNRHANVADSIRLVPLGSSLHGHTAIPACTIYSRHGDSLLLDERFEVAADLEEGAFGKTEPASLHSEVSGTAVMNAARHARSVLPSSGLPTRSASGALSSLSSVARSSDHHGDRNAVSFASFLAPSADNERSSYVPPSSPPNYSEAAFPRPVSAGGLPRDQQSPTASAGSDSRSVSGLLASWAVDEMERQARVDVTQFRHDQDQMTVLALLDQERRALDEKCRELNSTLAQKSAEHVSLQQCLEAKEIDLNFLREQNSQQQIDLDIAHKQLQDIRNDNTCVVCMDGEARHAAIPCGHLALCRSCAQQNLTSCCPVCRQRVNSFVRIFMS